MRCQEFKEMMDSYLAGELLVETNHEVLRHLENCPACRSELAAQRGLLAQMRAAFTAAPEMQLNPVFAGRLQNDLRQTALRPSVWAKLKSGVFVNSPVLTATMAACLLIGILFGAIWLSRSPSTENTVARQNQTDNSTETVPETEAGIGQILQAAWREMTHAAVGDHKNCALDFRLAEEPIPLKEAAEKYGKYNLDLDKTVLAALNENFDEKQTNQTADRIQFYEAHSCVYQGRRFAHVILIRRNRRVSVLVTEANMPASAGDEEIRSEATGGGMLAAHFRTARHVVYVVSDLTATENVAIAQKLSPAVRRHIEQAGA